MKDKVTIQLELTKIKSRAGGDVGNLECDNCEKQCQRTGEIWYECEMDYRILFFCSECVYKLKM